MSKWAENRSSTTKPFSCCQLMKIIFCLLDAANGYLPSYQAPCSQCIVTCNCLIYVYYMLNVTNCYFVYFGTLSNLWWFIIPDDRDIGVCFLQDIIFNTWTNNDSSITSIVLFYLGSASILGYTYNPWRIWIKYQSTKVIRTFFNQKTIFHKIIRVYLVAKNSFLNGPFPASFSLFSSFQYSWQ